MEKVTEKLLRYVKVDTQSDPTSDVRPSTKKQFELLNILVEELKVMGLHVDFDNENGYIYAKLEKNTEGVKPIGFLAHVDTAPDFSGTDVNPQIHTNYDGSTIVLNEDTKLDPEVFPSLKNYIGQTLITTDGTTLLGADDKAGISEIMSALEYFINNPEIPHGDVWVSFTTDEEIGTGANEFDLKRFPAEFAYTIDGGKIGELQFENFNAAGCSIKIVGRNVHPGTAKNQMISSVEIATKLHNALPCGAKPEYTDGYEGFIMLHSMTGTTEETILNYIIRDHDKKLFEQKKLLLQSLFDTLVLPIASQSTIEIQDQYYNMGEIIKPKYEIIDLAVNAMENVGVTPLIEPIRGGTDGARLSFMGLPCPNIFTGGHNFHGKYEYIVEESMLKATETIIEIIKLNVKK